MEIYQAIVLGIVQGLTEFLPISSSGHVLLVSKIFGITCDDMFFSVALHFGTLVPVVSLFFKDILSLFKKPYGDMLKIILATLPIVAVGLFLSDIVDKIFYGGKFLGLGFFFSAVVLVLSDVFAKKNKALYEIDNKRAFLIGLSQAVAVLPGVSRSGITVCAGVFMKAKKEDLSKFSFLLSIPVILGALILEGAKCIVTPVNIEILPLIFGVLFAIISGFLSIKFMMLVIKKASYKWFGIYLLILILFLPIIPL